MKTFEAITAVLLLIASLCAFVGAIYAAVINREYDKASFLMAFAIWCKISANSIVPKEPT